MGKISLAIDEVILLEDGDIAYKGSIDHLDYLDKVILTNKRIIAEWSKKKDINNFEIQLKDIKIYNNELQVDYFEDDLIGNCLRIQSINGTELLSLNDNIDDSLVNTFKKMLSSKANSSEYKTIMTWIDKIKEAYTLDNKDVLQNSKKEPPAPIADHNQMIKIKEEINTCSKCGEKLDKTSHFCPSCGTSIEKNNTTDPIKVIEHIICRKCGTKINADSKFCPSCGTSVIETPTPEIKEDKKQRKINAHKCSYCGEFLPSDALKCPSCGHEIRGRETTMSVAAFFDKISNIDDEQKKIEAIKLYPIPNNKEDITEFMFLATSSFDVDYYVTNKQGDSIANAWYTKIEQCYKKTVMMFADPSDIRIIEQLYKDIQLKTYQLKRLKFFMKIIGIVLIIVSLFMIGLSPRAEDGTAEVTVLSYISLSIFGIGITLLVKGLKKKKTNNQIEEERIEKLNKKTNNSRRG